MRHEDLTIKVETGVTFILGACLTRGLITFLLSFLYFYVNPQGSTDIDSTNEKQKFVLFSNDFRRVCHTTLVRSSNCVMNFQDTHFPLVN